MVAAGDVRWFVKMAQLLVFMVGGIFAGYTASNLDPAFLDAFTRPTWQFATFLTLSAAFLDFSLVPLRAPVREIVLSAAVMVVIMQLLPRKKPATARP